jgi:hypothetical protein
MGSVNFVPASINFQVTQPGGATDASTSCAALSAPASVTASISDDNSGGALTVLSVKSFIIDPEIEVPDSGEGPLGKSLKPVKIEVTDYLGVSDGVNPLEVLSGQSVEVDIRFSPTASTPYSCSSTLLINGDTWAASIQVPITAIVGEVKVEVPPITVAQSKSTTVPVTVSLSAGPPAAVSLALELFSTLSPEGFLSLNKTSGAISSMPPVSAPFELTASAGNLAPGAYAFYLSVSVFGDFAYNFAVPITLNVVVPYYVIKSKMGNVIDIVGASTRCRKTRPPQITNFGPSTLILRARDTTTS